MTWALLLSSTAASKPVDAGGFANFAPSGSDRYVLTGGDVYTVVIYIPPNQELFSNDLGQVIDADGQDVYTADPANLFQPSDAFAFEFSDGGVLIIDPDPADLLLDSAGDTLFTSDGFRLVL